MRKMESAVVAGSQLVASRQAEQKTEQPLNLVQAGLLPGQVQAWLEQHRQVISELKDLRQQPGAERWPLRRSERVRRNRLV